MGDYRHYLTISSQSSFKKEYENLATSGSYSAGGSVFGIGKLSVNVRGSYQKVTESVGMESRYEKLEEDSKTEFDPRMLQIIQEIETTVTIGTSSATTRSTDYVDSVPIDMQLSWQELRDRAVDYLRYHYGNYKKGKI